MPDLSSQELINVFEKIETKAAASPKGAAADGELAVQIWDEFMKAVVPETGREITIPKPTLGMLQVYNARHEYFEDAGRGLGRLLWALAHQRDRDAFTRLRLGLAVPEDEAEVYAQNVLPEEVGPYYILFMQAATYGAETSKKKVAAYLSTRTPPSPKSSSSPDIPSTK